MKNSARTDGVPTAAPAVPAVGPLPPREQRHGFEPVIRKNIFELVQVRRKLDATRSLDERMADALTRFAGTMRFAYLHALLFGGWIIVNTGVVPGLRPFDPFPFVMLAMFASVEAIFLSTFVLISQNRAGRIAEQRAELDLQINLLAEHEITRLMNLVDAIARKLDVPVEADEIEPLKKDVSPTAVLEQIERVERGSRPEPGPPSSTERPSNT